MVLMNVGDEDDVGRGKALEVRLRDGIDVDDLAGVGQLERRMIDRLDRDISARCGNRVGRHRQRDRRRHQDHQRDLHYATFASTVICIDARYAFETGHRPSASFATSANLEASSPFKPYAVTVSFDDRILMPASPLSAVTVARTSVRDADAFFRPSVPLSAIA